MPASTYVPTTLLDAMEAIRYSKASVCGRLLNLVYPLAISELRAESKMCIMSFELSIDTKHNGADMFRLCQTELATKKPVTTS